MTQAKPDSSKISVHAAVARALAEAGVDTVFGIVGEANLLIVEDFVTTYGGAYVNTVHENGAVMMADGYARSTGRLGVASVTLGPGLTNTVTALTEAVKSRSPVLLVAGDTVRGAGPILPQIDQEAVVAPTGATFVNVETGATLLREVARAIRIAVNDSHPVVLNIPMDLLDVEIDWQQLPFLDTRQRASADVDLLDKALGILASARRPLVLAGRGAISDGAKAAMLDLAGIIGAPVMTSIGARGLFHGHPGNLGVCGTVATPVAAETIAAADCIVSFGAGLNNFTTAAGTIIGGKQVIQVDLNSDRLSNPLVGTRILGDATAVASALAESLREAGIESTGFASKELEAKLAAYSPWSTFVDRSDGTTVDPRAAIVRLNELLPADRIVAVDAGHFMVAPLQFMDVTRAGSFILASSFASIGLGLGAAIGAAWADRDRSTVLVSGDGGLMSCIAEFNTAVRYDLDLTVVVVNDGGYGAEYHNLVIADRDPKLSLVAWPDLAQVAEALGGRGVTVRSIAELEAAVGVFSTRDRPLLIDLRVDPALHMETCLV